MAQRPRLFSPPSFEPALPTADRKAQGIYYTPPEIAECIVDWTVGPLVDQQRGTTSPPRILDPSCGAGEFLIAAVRRLSAVFGVKAVRSAVWGIDIDQSAVLIAQSRLRTIDRAFPIEQIITGDTLTTDAFTPASFDAVVGNPPYVNIRQLAKTLTRDQIGELRQTYATASGNFDLYVLFIERAIELLKPGGRCGLIVPGKWATLDYARPCRELLLATTTLERVVDLSDSRAFAAASVYPHILVFQKTPAGKSHAIRLSDCSHPKGTTIRQCNLSANAIQLSPLLDIESRIASARLSEVATINCGTTGYAAQKIARRIVDCSGVEAAANANLADFITSGNIDRYAVRLGNVRYLNHDYPRPRLPLDIPDLSPAKRRLFSQPKIVVAGMSRRLEAAWDDTGLALGVQVYAVSECQLDPYYLLAVLNSKLISFLFATRYAAKRLSGGYLAINKGQLARLPVRIITAEDRADDQKSRRLSQLARDWSPSHEASVDRLVYELYRLTEAEITRIESHFAQPAKVAA